VEQVALPAGASISGGFVFACSIYITLDAIARIRSTFATSLRVRDVVTQTLAATFQQQTATARRLFPLIQEAVGPYLASSPIGGSFDLPSDPYVDGPYGGVKPSGDAVGADADDVDGADGADEADGDFDSLPDVGVHAVAERLEALRDRRERLLREQPEHGRLPDRRRRANEGKELRVEDLDLARARALVEHHAHAAVRGCDDGRKEARERRAWRRVRGLAHALEGRERHLVEQVRRDEILDCESGRRERRGEGEVGGEARASLYTPRIRASGAHLSKAGGAAP
jgi:hypothetical protein